MKSTGIVRKLDSLGRIVLPKELRSTMEIEEKDPIEFFIDNTRGTIVLRKYQGRLCIFCGSPDQLFLYKERLICQPCSSSFSVEGSSQPNIPDLTQKQEKHDHTISKKNKIQSLKLHCDRILFLKDAFCITPLIFIKVLNFQVLDRLILSQSQLELKAVYSPNMNIHLYL
ncbi:AbrB/MazE/SpoVT family DNA-binding domain-containing protein [Paenibacillus sp. NPDC057886]|uniref:AbrB/MazE/SpoVT family DNA-binding domain-containing protein n=1 Tax=Paenibacillus sp. NPDC057886 TaxID=3346270 RepID=UPI0036BDF667